MHGIRSKQQPRCLTGARLQIPGIHPSTDAANMQQKLYRDLQYMRIGLLHRISIIKGQVAQYPLSFNTWMPNSICNMRCEITLAWHASHGQFAIMIAEIRMQTDLYQVNRKQRAQKLILIRAYIKLPIQLTPASRPIPSVQRIRNSSKQSCNNT
jgi:hypothetical protein